MNNKLTEKEKSEYLRCQKDAIKRGYTFSLSENQYKHTINSKCFYCGADPRKHSNGLVRNGIDRANNTKGYDYNNIVASCTTCNRMKRTLTMEEFNSHINRISSNMKKTLDYISVVGSTSAEFNAYMLQFGKYLSPNEIFNCISKGLLSKSDIKYDFKTALADFKSEFIIVKNQMRSSGIKLKNFTREHYDKLQMKLWHNSNSVEEYEKSEQEQMLEVKNMISGIRKYKNPKKINLQEYYNIKEFMPDITSEKIMDIPPFER